ncbi:MAG: 16S rRNA pseudouridine(516) synthase, partial [Anaerotignum sp.]|nr:16S rRNA pseudouridine(516) synthase [Anaerotignum sp.]
MAMERIDKIIASQGLYSRSDVKYMVNKKRITVDGKVVTSASQKADVDKNEIMLDGKPFVVKKQIYLMLNKPKGYVSATEDKKQ